LKRAATFGIDVLVNPQQVDLREVVLAETGGIGADAVIVAAPAAEPQEQAIGLVRKRGVVCLFASLPAGKSALTLDSRPVHYGELKIVGASDSSPRQVETAVALLGSGRFPAEKLVTHQFGLAGIHQAFGLMQRGEALRVVLRPAGEDVVA